MRNWILLICLPFWLNSQSDYKQLALLLEQKQYERVEVLTSEILKDNEDDIRAIEFLGDAYGYQKKWDKAIEQYKKLVVRQPKNADFHYKYGGALGMKSLSISKIRALSLIGDVKKSFLKAAELDPNHLETRWALVELYIQLPGILGGSRNKALDYANELAILSEVDGFLSKGYVYEQTKNSSQAEHYYKKAVEVGGSVTCYNKLSELYEKENQPEKAISNIEDSYEKHVRNTSHYQIGRICATYNIQLDKGKACLLKYIEDYTTRDAVPIEWAYMRLAQISKLRQDKLRALDYIDKAILVNPDFEEARLEKQKIIAL